mmetsp:Transcript_90011/g.197082  ORF Transcript_90011/g.197082 Transcript_90011/m.197082 type:complete len:520 (+) Transcript_90011:36-1595(+)
MLQQMEPSVRAACEAALKEQAAREAIAWEEQQEEEARKPPARKPPAWKKVEQPQFQVTEMVARANKSLPGDYYAIKFPRDKDEILQMGPSWLTKAFQTTGVLGLDNTVIAIDDAREFVGGGAGLKCILKVRYKNELPHLHNELFVKLPHKPGGSDRYFVSCMWNHDRPETIFNIWLEPCVPYRVPKMYFSDICAESTNFILITETIPWTKKGQVIGPGEIEPAYDKYMDWELPNTGVEHYHTLCKALGKIAAYHKAGKLHPQMEEMFPMPDINHVKLGVPPFDAAAKKKATHDIDQLIKFLSETAKEAFPKDVSDAQWLERWKSEALHFMSYSQEVALYCFGEGTAEWKDYVTFTHNNLQIDNAFFWRREDGVLEVGLLDWGVLSCAPFASAVQGCISGAEAEVLLQHRDAFLETAVNSYLLYGGPKLNLDRFTKMNNLQMMSWACGITANVTQVMKHTKKNEWSDIKDWMDPKLVGRFQTRTHCSQFKIALQLWRQMGLYEKFLDWVKEEKLPAKIQV